MERQPAAGFPSYVHTVLPSTDAANWPVQAQGSFECDFASTANALNILVGERRYSKDLLVREALFLFQPRFGGTVSPLKVYLIRRRGFGTHFGNLTHTNYEQVLRELIDCGIPTLIEIGVAARIGGKYFYGQHTVVLVGYSDPYRDAGGETREEYYLLDAQWPLAGFDINANNVDRDGDGVAEVFPGNRTLSRAEFGQIYPTRLYFPIFRSQQEHDEWYRARLRRRRRLPLVGWLDQLLVSGSYDQLSVDPAQRSASSAVDR